MFKLNIFMCLILSNVVILIQAQKLNVLILYEALCPDSENFMAYQLGPSYDLLDEYIHVTFVPFGKARSENNGSEFFCQHGPAECEANRLQLCVLNQSSDKYKQAQFVVCQMRQGDRLSVDTCTSLAGLSNDVNDCMKGIGKELQLEAEKLTKAFNPTFIPTIIYDGVFNPILQQSSLSNFHGTVCAILKERGTISNDNTACR